MAQVLDLHTVKARLRDYGLMAHTQVASLMMSGILAFAALSLLDIVRTPDLRLLRLLMWTSALTAETAVLVRQMQRPVLATRARGFDVAILTVRGVFALLSFALIAPQTGGEDGWKFLFPCGAVLLVCGAALRWQQNKQLTLVAPPLEAAAEAIRQANARSLSEFPIGVLIVSAIFAFVVVAPDRATYVIVTVAILTLVSLRGSALALIRAHREFEAFEDAVDEALAAQEASGNR
jgi:hypothetical protein